MHRLVVGSAITLFHNAELAACLFLSPTAQDEAVALTSALLSLSAGCVLDLLFCVLVHGALPFIYAISTEIGLHCVFLPTEMAEANDE